VFVYLSLRRVKKSRKPANLTQPYQATEADGAGRASRDTRELHPAPHPPTFKTVRALQRAAAPEASPENSGLRNTAHHREQTSRVFGSPALLQRAPASPRGHAAVNLGCLRGGVPPAFWTDQHQRKAGFFFYCFTPYDADEWYQKL